MIFKRSEIMVGIDFLWKTDVQSGDLIQDLNRIIGLLNDLDGAKRGNYIAGSGLKIDFSGDMIQTYYIHVNVTLGTCGRLMHKYEKGYFKYLYKMLVNN